MSSLRMKPGSMKQRGRTGDWRVKVATDRLQDYRGGMWGRNIFGIFEKFLLTREISPYQFLLRIYIYTLEITPK